MFGAATAAIAIALGSPGFYTANGLFLTIVMTDLVRNAGQIVYFRLEA
jgi:hypothetical protein